MALETGAAITLLAAIYSTCFSEWQLNPMNLQYVDNPLTLRSIAGLLVVLVHFIAEQASAILMFLALI